MTAGKLLMALSALALSACATTSNPGTTASADTAAGQTRLAALTGGNAPAANELPEPADHRLSLALQRRTYGTVELPEVQMHLQGTLERLQKTWPAKPRPASVFLTPDPAFVAYSTKDGGIYISQGMLRSLTTEDELAAVLAHEYAHVMLDHHEESLIAKGARYAYSGALMYMSYSGKTDLEKNSILLRYALTELGMESVQSAIVPAMSRGDEEAADELGIDLLLRAGYNDTGMTDFLTRLEAWESQGQAREVDKSARFTKLIDFKSGATANGYQMQIGFGTLINDLASEITERGTKLYDDASRNHQIVQKRLAKTQQYLEQFYSEADAPAVTALPWSAAEAKTFFAGFDELRGAQKAMEEKQPRAALQYADRAMQSGGVGAAAYTRLVATLVLNAAGQRDGAVALQEQAVLTEDSLLPEHVSQIEMLERKDPKAALRVADRAYELFDSPGELLPARVRLNRLAGSKTTSSLLVAKCLATASRTVKDACVAAQK